MLSDVEAGARGNLRPVRLTALAARRAMHDGTQPPILLVADRVQDEPFSWREADPHPPLLPPQAEPVELEAGSVRLDDLDRSEIVAEGTDVVRAVVPVLGRERQDTVVVDPHDAHRVQIDERHGPRSAARTRCPLARGGTRRGLGHTPLVSAVPKLPADQMSTITASTSVILARKRIHERRVGLDHRLGLDGLVGMDRRMHALYFSSVSISPAARAMTTSIVLPASGSSTIANARRGSEAPVSNR